MTDDNKAKRSNNERFEKGGYQPLDEGYTPSGEQRGYVPKANDSQGVPPLPSGGTAQSPKPAKDNSE